MYSCKGERCRNNTKNIRSWLSPFRGHRLRHIKVTANIIYLFNEQWYFNDFVFSVFQMQLVQKYLPILLPFHIYPGLSRKWDGEAVLRPVWLVAYYTGDGAVSQPFDVAEVRGEEWITLSRSPLEPFWGTILITISCEYMRTPQDNFVG